MNIADTTIARITSIYLDANPSEADNIASLLEALRDAGSIAIANRRRLNGHATCSAAIVNTTGQVLHILHNQLGKWLLPGGHFEPGDATIVDAVKREILEEVGIAPHDLHLRSEMPLHIDIHRIPHNHAKREPEHWHYDLCYTFDLLTDSAVTLQRSEIGDAAWIHPSEMDHKRLAHKLAPIWSEGVMGDGSGRW